jgi:hypothetical protein
MKFFKFFYFCGSFLPYCIRIWIPKTDPDPLTRLIPDLDRIRILIPGVQDSIYLSVWYGTVRNALIMHYAFEGTECSLACEKNLLVDVQNRRIKKGKDGWCTTSNFNSSSSSCLLATISLPHSHLPRQQQNGLMWAIWLYGLGRGGGRVVGTILAVQNCFLTPAYPSLCLSR